MTALAPRITPIRVRVPHPRPCLAARCEVPAAWHLVWLALPKVEVRVVCEGHRIALKQAGPCLVFPLGALPPMPTLVAAIDAELARRRAAQMRATQVFTWVGSTGTGTGGSFNFSFG